MISINGLDYLKAAAELEADIIPGGIIFLVSDGEKYVWRKASKVFDLDIFQVGEKLKENGITKKAFRETKTVIENVQRSLYGIRLKIVSEPLVNEKGKAVGTFTIALPLLHPVAKSFTDFAPILAEMSPEGAFLFVTDLTKIAYKQASKKFDMPIWQIGYELKEEDVAARAIKTKQHLTVELDSSSYGVPVLITCYPLFEVDNPNDVVCTLGVVIPKILAGNLRDMSNNLESGLSGISAAIEQLVASASSIHTNEQELNTEISGIISLSEEINEVSTFIKVIADETKMLGLNAAIESARAGEAGRGFGVVAEQIRKLSDQSKSTVPKIKDLTDRIKSKVDEASKKSENSLSSSQEQAAATEEITASIQEITSMSSELNKIAHEL
jgi:hypothetical protein